MKIASANHSGERLLGVAALALGILVTVLFLAWLLQGPPIGVPVAASAPAGAGDAASAVPAASSAQAKTLEGTAATVPVPVRERAAAARGGEAAAKTAVLYGAVRTPEPLDAGSARRVRGFVRLLHDDKQKASARVSDCFAFPGLRPGRYELRVERDGHVPAAVEVDVTAPRTRVDVDLEAAWLLTVNARTPGGESFVAAVHKAAPELLGLGGLGVVALREPLTADLPPSTTRSPRLGVGRLAGNGEPFGPALPDGVVGVLQLPNGTPLHVALLLRNVLLGTQLVAPGQDEVTFTLSVDALLAKTATLRLRVVDAAGSPVAARIGLSDRSSGGSGKPVDGEGRIVLVAQRPGRLNLDMQAHPLALPYFDVLLPVGGEVDLGEVIALPAAEVELETGDEAMRLDCVAIDPPPHRSLSARRISVSGEGGERSLSLYPGRYHLLATASGERVATATFDTRTLTGPVRLELRAAPKLTLKNEAGARLVEVVLRNRDGVLVYERELSGRWQTTMPLPDGTYTATLTDMTGAVTQRRFELGAKGYELTVP